MRSLFGIESVIEMYLTNGGLASGGKLQGDRLGKRIQSNMRDAPFQSGSAQMVNENPSDAGRWLRTCVASFASL